MKYLKTQKPVTAYLASGWFNEAEEAARQEMLAVLNENEISYFSPFDEVPLSFNATPEERREAFRADTEVIRKCDFVVASTVGKDMGTLMEMGMSYAWGTPYIVYFPAPKGTPCNVMIAESAYAVAQSKEELDSIIKELKKNNFDFSKRLEYTGGIE